MSCLPHDKSFPIINQGKLETFINTLQSHYDNNFPPKILKLDSLKPAHGGKYDRSFVRFKYDIRFKFTMAMQFVISWYDWPCYD